MEIISRELIFYGRNYAFYWVTVRQADGSMDRFVQAVKMPVIRSPKAGQ